MSANLPTIPPPSLSVLRGRRFLVNNAKAMSGAIIILSDILSIILSALVSALSSAMISRYLFERPFIVLIQPTEQQSPFKQILVLTKNKIHLFIETRQ
jgi:hypothetical protein